MSVDSNQQENGDLYKQQLNNNKENKEKYLNNETIIITKLSNNKIIIYANNKICEKNYLKQNSISNTNYINKSPFFMIVIKLILNTRYYIEFRIEFRQNLRKNQYLANTIIYGTG